MMKLFSNCTTHFLFSSLFLITSACGRLDYESLQDTGTENPNNATDSEHSDHDSDTNTDTESDYSTDDPLDTATNTETDSDSATEPSMDSDSDTTTDFSTDGNIDMSTDSTIDTETETSTDTDLTPPTLLSPPDGSVFSHFPREVNYEWTSVPFAQGYDIDIEVCSINGCSDGSSPLFESPYYTETPTYTNNFVGAQAGRWRVRTVYSDSVSDYSEWWEFRFTVK